LIVRGFVGCFGNHDFALRLLGVSAGICFLFAAWFSAQTTGGSPPLLSLAICGFSPTFLVWGTTIGGYGFGTALIVLTLGALGRLLQKPSPFIVLLTFFAALASEQFVVGNVTLTLVIAVSALIVAMATRRFRTAMLVAALALCCSVAGVLYLKIFAAGDWRIVLHEPCHLSGLWLEFVQACGGSVISASVVSAGVIASMVIGLWSLRNPASNSTAVFWFALLVAILTPLAYFGSLLLLSYGTHPWHYLLLLGLIAVAVDMALVTLSRTNSIRIARLIIAAITAVVFSLPAFRAATQRETNIDTLAAKLTELAGPHDLIVVAPWQFGLSFQRYYRGETPWITLPEITDHRIHRYDLMRDKMISSHPIDDVLTEIRSTLVSGHRVWLVGGIRLPADGRPPLFVAPAPDPHFGWDSTAYTEAWVEQLAVFVWVHGREHHGIDVGADKSVNAFERIPLAMVAGWE
jgi:4-amino-4-deoxy-L-arabinose transferase-like glycosyltransferase